MRKSLCNPNTVTECQNPSTYAAKNTEPHTSLNCYVRYMDLGFEPGETFLTLEEWARD